MRKVIRIPLVKRFSQPPANDHNLHHIEERNRKDKKRDEHRPMSRMPDGIEVRQNGENCQKITDEVTPGIAEEGARIGEIVRKKTQQSAKSQESNDRDQI